MKVESSFFLAAYRPYKEYGSDIVAPGSTGLETCFFISSIRIVA